MSSQAFAGLGASEAVVEALAEGGIHEPFPVQELVIPDVLEGRDVLVKSPTGSGKTLAFAVPMVDRIESKDPRPSALILVPTRELAAELAPELDADKAWSAIVLREQRASPRDPRTGLTMLLVSARAIELRVRN